MADLKSLVNELPKLFHKLNLTIGNSHDLMQQVMIISNVQERLRNIQQLVAQEVKISKNQNNSITTLTRMMPDTSLLRSSVSYINTDITTRERFITEQFFPLGTETSFIDFQIKIDSWLEWGDLLQAIAADILSDAQLVKQLSSNINYPSLPAKFQEVEEIFKNYTLSQKSLQNGNFQEDILQLSQRVNNIINTINKSQNLLSIILGISCFFGKSEFTLEWLDDYHDLMISSDGKFQDLTEIINNCELFKEQIETLILQSNTLTKQSEPVLLEDKSEEKQDSHDEAIVLPNIIIQKKPQKHFKLGHLTLVMASSLAVLGFGGWISKDRFPTIQQKNQSFNQEESAVTNFKSALKLGSEASKLAQTPPQPLIVWQQAEIKWQEAINLLASIPEGTSVYTQAQNKLARYRFNHNAISKKVLKEKKAVTDLQLAEKLATEATFFVQNSPRSSLIWQQALDKWQQAIHLLEAIPESTFVSQQAKEALPSYKTNYAAMSTVIND